MSKRLSNPKICERAACGVKLDGGRAAHQLGDYFEAGVFLGLVGSLAIAGEKHVNRPALERIQSRRLALNDRENDFIQMLNSRVPVIGIFDISDGLSRDPGLQHVGTGPHRLLVEIAPDAF